MTLAIRLDVDARNSIHINETGNGSYNFRPQVFVEIMDAEQPGRLIFVEGIVREIESAESSAQIWLCEVAVIHRDREGQRDRHCVTVFGSEETSVFDESGLPSDLSRIAVGARIGVIGRFAIDDEDRSAIEAEIIELGGAEAFLSLTGVVSGDYNADTRTILPDLDPGQGIESGSAIEIDVADETKIFSAEGEGVDPVEIVVDTRLEVDGVLVLSSESRDLIRAAVIFVHEIAAPDTGSTSPNWPMNRTFALAASARAVQAPYPLTTGRERAGEFIGTGLKTPNSIRRDFPRVGSGAVKLLG